MGFSGKGEEELICHINFSINDTNGDLYICDRNNNCIQILNQNFRIIAQFGNVYSSNLVMLNFPKNTFSFLMNLILVSISLTIITFYRSVLFLEVKECKLLIHITSSLTKLIIFLFQIMVLIPFLSSLLNSSCFIRFLFQTIQWELQ